MDSPAVDLVEVDETVLAELVDLAVRDAHPNEVTPPITPGEDWSAERVEWLRSFHRNRRAGLSAGTAGACWAVRADGLVVGAARLERTGKAGCLETGVWLGRSARHRGLGRATLSALMRIAADAGADTVCAETTGGNRGALAILRGLGFETVSLGREAEELPGRAGGPSLRACRALRPTPGGAGR